MSRPILIVGIGNEYRSDDGVGLVVARELQARELPHILATERSGDGTELMEIWNTADTAILIDAVASGAKPGTIYRWDALHTHTANSSNFFLSLDPRLRCSRGSWTSTRIRPAPPCLVIYAIEGKNFAAGKGLSLEGEKAVREVVERVASEVQHILNVTNPRK